MYIEKLIRRLNRLKQQQEELELKHKGNELQYTYWGGYNLGYIKGKISEIENILEILGVNTAQT